MDDQGPSGSHYFGRRIEASPAVAVDAQAAPPTREPFSRAPWPALLLAGSILGLFALQTALGSVDGWNERWGLRPQGLSTPNGALTLVTAMWSHANWGHAGANAVFALAFGAPVARLFGLGLRGAGLFLLFYMVGGVISSLGFVALHPGDDVVLVGASGAISALTGAATRLLLRPPADDPSGSSLAPFTSAPVIVMTFAFVTANLILGLFSIDLGQGDAPLAWEAHLAGFAAGLLLIGPFATVARRIAAPGPQPD